MGAVARWAERLKPMFPEPVRDAGLTMVGSVVGVRTREPVVALTFDDGPDPVGTDQVLAALARGGVRATFFVLARRAERYPEVIARIAGAGHEVGLHGDEHLRLAGAPVRDMIRVIRTGRRRLERVLGRKVTLFRPPGGQQSPLSFLVARTAGLEVVQWSAAAEDWLDLPPDVLVQRALSGLAPGGILLLHDRFEPDPVDGLADPGLDRGRFMDELLPAIAAQGLRSLTVGELIGRHQPHRGIWFTRPERAPRRI